MGSTTALFAIAAATAASGYAQYDASKQQAKAAQKANEERQRELQAQQAQAEKARQEALLREKNKRPVGKTLNGIDFGQGNKDLMSVQDFLIPKKKNTKNNSIGGANPLDISIGV